MEGYVDSMKDMLERAGWTFAQSFLAVFVIGDMATLKTALIAAASATLSIVKRYTKEKVGS